MEMYFKSLATNKEIMGADNPFKNFSRSELIGCWKEYQFVCSNGFAPPGGILEELLNKNDSGKTGMVKLVNLSVQLITVMACRYYEKSE